jgi:hypothetical protein
MFSDTISSYTYGEPLGFLAQDGWEKNYREAMDAFLHTMYIFRFFTPLRHLVAIAPYIQGLMPTHMANLFRMLTETLPYHICRATEGEAKTQGRIFADLLDSSLPDEEKTIFRLSGEGFSLATAGTETTAVSINECPPPPSPFAGIPVGTPDLLTCVPVVDAIRAHWD